MTARNYPSARAASHFVSALAILLAGAALFLAPNRGSTATVVGNIQDVTSRSYGGLVNQIQFTPLSCPQAIGTNTVWPVAKSARLTNGLFSISLVGGLYYVGIVEGASAVTPKTVKILVPPNDTNEYNLNYCANLATNLGTFVWTNNVFISAGTNIVFTTNGAMIVINSTASGSTLTNLFGVIEGNPTNNTFSTTGSNQIAAIAATVTPSLAITNNQTNVTLTGSFTAIGGNVVTNDAGKIIMSLVPGNGASYISLNDGAAYSAYPVLGTNPVPVKVIDFQGMALYGPNDIVMEWNNCSMADLGSNLSLNWNTRNLVGNWTADSISGSGSGLTNLQSTNLVGVLPMGTLTTLPVVTNGFLTTDGANRSYSKNAQYLTNVQDSALSTNVALLGANQAWSGTNLFIVKPSSYLTVSNSSGASQLIVKNNVNGMSLNGDYPGFGLNSYYDGFNWRAFSAFYTGLFQIDPGTGDWMFSTGSNPGAGNAVSFSTIFYLRKSGVVESAVKFVSRSTVTATNGFIGSLYGGTPQTNAPTLSAIRAAGMNTNWGFDYWSNDIPATKISAQYTAQSNLIYSPILVGNITLATPVWIDAIGDPNSLSSGGASITYTTITNTAVAAGINRGPSSPDWTQGSFGDGSWQFNHGMANTNALFPALYVNPHLHCSITTPTASTTNATFKFDYVWTVNGGTWTNAVSGSVTATVTNMAPHQLYILSFGNITNNAASGTVSSILEYQLSRPSALPAGDVVDVHLHDIDCHYPVTRLGSSTPSAY